MSKKNRGALIHCPSCGEDYSDAYRRCPFCNARRPKGDEEYDEEAVYTDEGYEDEPAAYDDAPEEEESEFEPISQGPYQSGGKRLAGNTRGGGYGRRKGRAGRVILYIVTLLLLAAIIWIAVTLIMPRLSGCSSPKETPSPSPSPSAVVSSTPTPTPTPTPPAESEAPADLPGESDAPAPSDAPSQAPTAAPATGLTLSREDFTLSDKYPTYRITASGASGTVTWSIADTSVATVSESGLVTAVKNGTTKLTATDAAGFKATCIVRVSGFSGGASQEPSSAPAPTPAPSEAPSAAPTEAPTQTPPENTDGASLNYTDFTISPSYPDPVQLRVRGGTAVSWSSNNEAVATVDSRGIVSGHTKGTATITCSLDDGTSLTCIVRVTASFTD